MFHINKQILEDFPVSLNSIKEYITEKDGNTYIPLHSTVVLKKRRRMLYLPLEVGEITMDGLVDSGAFIKAMSWSDYNAIQMNSDSCILKNTHNPLSKLNAQMPNWSSHSPHRTSNLILEP